MNQSLVVCIGFLLVKHIYKENNISVQGSFFIQNLGPGWEIIFEIKKKKKSK